MIQDSLFTPTPVIDSLSSHIQTLVTNNQFFQGGLVLGLITWILLLLKQVPMAGFNWLKRKLTYTVNISETQGRESFFYFVTWYQKHYPKQFRVMDIHFSVLTQQDEMGTSRMKVDTIRKISEDSQTIWIGRGFVRISVKKSNHQHSHGLFDLFYKEVSITGFLAKNAVERIVKQIAEEALHYESKYSALAIYTHNGIDTYRLAEMKSYRTLDTVFTCHKQRLLEFIKQFRNLKKQSQHVGMRNKLGLLLYGPPGTGKTSVALALGAEIGIPVYLVNLKAFMTDVHLIQYLNHTTHNRILLFEECHEMLGTERPVPVQGTPMLSDSTILQALDGVLSPENAILIFTTNYKEQLHPTFFRAGRISLELCMDKPRWQDIQDFIQHFYSTNYKLSVSDLEEIPGISLAEVEQLCCRFELKEALREITISTNKYIGVQVDGKT